MPKPSPAPAGFFWQRGNRNDWMLCRKGATEACVVCGISDPGCLTYMHIHEEDVRSSPDRSPDQDPRRVIRGCYNHHFGVYGRYRVSTEFLLERERIWIEEPSRRPQPHPRDIELTQRESLGCEWTGGRWEQLPLLARMHGERDRE